MADALEIRMRPEAGAAERRAIEAALKRVQEEAAAPVRSAWWAVGVRENASDSLLERPRP